MSNPVWCSVFSFFFQGIVTLLYMTSSAPFLLKLCAKCVHHPFVFLRSLISWHVVPRTGRHLSSPVIVRGCERTDNHPHRFLSLISRQSTAANGLISSIIFCSLHAMYHAEHLLSFSFFKPPSQRSAYFLSPSCFHHRLATYLRDVQARTGPGLTLLSLPFLSFGDSPYRKLFLRVAYYGHFE